jgi:hypothetical protein
MFIRRDSAESHRINADCGLYKINQYAMIKV